MGKLIDKRNLRVDGRKLDELRPIKIQVGVLKNADGSAYIEWGRNKIMVGVYGPKECHPKHMALPDRALLKCRYHMAPFSVDERKPPQPSRREIELSKIIREALSPAIVLEEFPRTAIEIYVEVLQSDGSSRVASITAASVALADAGIPMRDLVAGCAVGKVDGKIIADVSDIEDKEGEVDLPVAYMPNLDLVTLLQSDGALTKAEFEKAFKLALEKCRFVYDMQRSALLEGFMKTKREVE
ncbi:MAG: exosome complex exonuclease Rrp41 [Conexivisphaerales archaeon]